MNKEKININGIESFGVAEFKIICTPKEVKLVIDKKHIVAKTDKNVYEKIFKHAVEQLGGRIDNY